MQTIIEIYIIILITMSALAIGSGRYLIAKKLYHLFSYILLIFGLIIWYKFSSENHTIKLIKLFGFYEILLEKIAVIFILIFSLLLPFTVTYALGYFNLLPEVNEAKFFFLLTASIIITFFLALAKDLFQTYIFYELLTLSTFPLIRIGKTNEERKASIYYLYFLLISSIIFFLPTIAYFYVQLGTLNFQNGGILDLTKINNFQAKFIFVILLLGIAKAAVFPVHSWLVKAMAAHAPVSALLHAVAVVKAGVIVIFKISVYTYGYKKLGDKNLQEYGQIIVLISIFIVSILAALQSSLKKLLAYSTINNLSICLLAIFLANKTSFDAALLQIFAHSSAKITLFFCVGYFGLIYQAKYINDIQGMFYQEKLIAFCFILASFSIIAIPPFLGYYSKDLIRHSINDFSGSLILKNATYLTLVFSTMLSYFYYGKILVKLFMKKISPWNVRSKEASNFMHYAIILSTIIFCFGFIKL